MPGSVTRILVPVDGSKGANDASAFAAGLAVDAGASLTLLYVLDSAASAIGLASLSQEEITVAKKSVSENAFAAALQAMGGKKPPVQKEVRLGHPAQDIIDFAAEEKTDLIIMGSRGLSPMEGLLLGSVSTKVLQHAPCAVTIVR